MRRVQTWSKIAGVGVVLAAGWACSGGTTPNPEPSPPPPPPEPTAAPLAAFDEEACRASVPAGWALGTWKANMGHGNVLTLHLHLPEGAGADGAEVEIVPGLEVVGWGELRVENVEELLDLEGVSGVPDPGSICVTSETAKGEVKAGKVIEHEKYPKAIELVLTGKVGQPAADAFWKHEAVAAALPSRLVPGYDTHAEGASYFMARMGAQGPHAYATGLEPQEMLRGDITFSLVDASGQAVYEMVTTR
jgi:hypothetical protein